MDLEQRYCMTLEEELRRPERRWRKLVAAEDLLQPGTVVFDLLPMSDWAEVARSLRETFTVKAGATASAPPVPAACQRSRLSASLRTFWKRLFRSFGRGCP